MPNVVFSYVLMLPVLLVIVATFIPLTTFLSTTWATQRVQTRLQDASRQLADTIGQLYYSLNQSQIAPGIVSQTSSVPTNIENYVYNGTGTLTTATGPNSVKILSVFLSAQGGRITASTLIPLGVNVKWINSVFVSSSRTAAIVLQKFTNGTITLSFR